MTPWQPGDPIGSGVVYFDDQASRDAYHAADQLAKKTALAKTLMRLPRSEAKQLAAIMTKKHGFAYVESIREIARRIQSEA